MFVSISDSKEFAQLLSSKSGIDFSQFSVPFFRRRLSFVCESLNIKRKQQFIEAVEQPQQCENILFQMAVPVSEMFRDPGFWRTMRTIIAQKNSGDRLRVWFPDATSCDELYSFIIMAEQMGIRKVIDIYVQYPNRLVVDDIKRGVLPAKSIKTNLSNFERLETKDSFESFFCDTEKDYILKPHLLDNIVFIEEWFVNFQPEGLFDIIFFRNSGLTLNKSFQEQCNIILVDKLAVGGFLTIGIKENLSENVLECVKCINTEERIFEKPLV